MNWSRRSFNWGSGRTTVDSLRQAPFSQKNAISTGCSEQTTIKNSTGGASRNLVDPPTPGKDPTCFQGGSNGERTSHWEAGTDNNVDRMENVCGCSQIGKGKTQTFIKTLFPSTPNCGFVAHIEQSSGDRPSECGLFYPLGCDPAPHGPIRC